MDTRPRVALAGKPVNVAQLASELGAVISVSYAEDGTAREVVAEDSIAQTVLDAVVAVHVADPLWSREAKVRHKIEQRIAQAENAYTTWPLLTNAQKDTVMREVVLAVAKLGRLALSKYDAAE